MLFIRFLCFYECSDRSQSTETMVKYNVAIFNAILHKLTYGFRQHIYNSDNVLLAVILKERKKGFL